jgi:hypothetical protein
MKYGTATGEKGGLIPLVTFTEWQPSNEHRILITWTGLERQKHEPTCTPHGTVETCWE